MLASASRKAMAPEAEGEKEKGDKQVVEAAEGWDDFVAKCAEEAAAPLPVGDDQLTAATRLSDAKLYQNRLRQLVNRFGGVAKASLRGRRPDVGAVEEVEELAGNIAAGVKELRHISGISRPTHSTIRIACLLHNLIDTEAYACSFVGSGCCGWF
jgi:hypothetical protein